MLDLLGLQVDLPARGVFRLEAPLLNFEALLLDLGLVFLDAGLLREGLGLALQLRSLGVLLFEIRLAL